MSRAPANIDQETALMRTIRDTMAAPIRAAIVSSAIPESFVAALVANESGGNAGATRYEPYELGQFALVLCGDRQDYQGITSAVLLGKILSGNVSDAVKKLVNICTSWGPTQIMGWHAIKDGYPIGDLSLLRSHFARAAGYLAAFQREFPQTAQRTDTAWFDLFTCWNAGRPGNPTSDPTYSARGLRRMKIYEGLQ
jgi:hypothetical protein